jgi:hypothetical protein
MLLLSAESNLLRADRSREQIPDLFKCRHDPSAEKAIICFGGLSQNLQGSQ